jgi:hypothetical protein
MAFFFFKIILFLFQKSLNFFLKFFLHKRLNGKYIQIRQKEDHK